MDTNKLYQFMHKIANYIEATQSLLDARDDAKDKFIKKAYHTAGVLVSRGFLAKEHVDEFVDKIAKDESNSELLDLVEKLANTIAADDLGSTAKVVASGKPLDPFERDILFGDSALDPLNMVS